MIKKMAFIGQPTWDMERAQKFYGEVLGMELEKDFGHGWAEYALPGGATIALDCYGPKLLGEDARPYLALEVEDLETYLEGLEEAGVEVIYPLTINHDEEDREICRLAVIRDSEGTAIMLHQIADWRA